MYGADVNTLHIYVRKYEILGAPVWSRSKNQGDGWLRGQLRISESVQYAIAFEAVIGATFQGVVYFMLYRLLKFYFISQILRTLLLMILEFYLVVQLLQIDFVILKHLIYATTKFQTVN
jgi:hypothetical protein